MGRGKQARQELSCRHHAASRIQAVERGKKGRKRAQNLKDNALPLSARGRSLCSDVLKSMSISMQPESDDDTSYDDESTEDTASDNGHPTATSSPSSARWSPSVNPETKMSVVDDVLSQLMNADYSNDDEGSFSESSLSQSVLAAVREAEQNANLAFCMHADSSPVVPSLK